MRVPVKWGGSDASNGVYQVRALLPRRGRRQLIDADMKAVHSQEWERAFSIFRLLI
jgi:hypothetical protein